MTKQLLRLSIFTFGFLCCYALFLTGIYLAFNDNLPGSPNTSGVGPRQNPPETVLLPMPLTTLLLCWPL